MGAISSSKTQLRLFSVSMAKDPYDNIPESITEMTGRKIYK